MRQRSRERTTAFKRRRLEWKTERNAKDASHAIREGRATLKNIFHICIHYIRVSVDI